MKPYAQRMQRVRPSAIRELLRWGADPEVIRFGGYPDDGALRYGGEHLPTLKSLDGRGRVLHLGSFSKILAPGSRLGWAVAEPDQRPPHVAHNLDPGFPPPPAGAQAGGPASKRYPGFPPDPQPDLPPQRRHLDAPTSETTSDVCIRWNAPLVYLAAYLSR